MPEGPEAYIMSKFIEKNSLNKLFFSITSNTKTKVDLPKESKVINCNSHGKVIFIKTEDYYVHIHLGITGWLVPKKPRIYKYILHFEGKDLYLQDRRRFSSIKILSEENHYKEINKLGLNLLSSEFNLENFSKIVKSKKKNICSLIMDQNIFAGIGNYIKNEALYLSKISPYRKSSDLNDDEILALFLSILFVTYSNLVEWHDSYKIKISSELEILIPDYLENPYDFYVYEKEKDYLKNKVKFDKTHCGRRTFYVTEIQK